MSLFSENEEPPVSRRRFLADASAFAGYCLINCEAKAWSTTNQSVQIEKALDDKNVIHGKIMFKSGNENLDAYLARPRQAGRYPVVIVISGNSIYEEYIQNLTAMLAQIECIGIAPNIYPLQKDSMTLEQKRKVLAEQTTDEKIFRDIESSISYLKNKRFADSRRVALTGFCFGGRCALMFAASYPKQVRAVVPFYGNLKTPVFANRKQDPIDVAENISAAVQGHYAENDNEIPPEQLEAFELALKKNNKDDEIFTYPAPHGFFAYSRPTYDADAAKLAWQRTTTFLHNQLAIRPLGRR